MDNAAYQSFWSWFLEHEEVLFHFERDQEAVFDLLGGVLSPINRYLTFAFGPIEQNQKRELVISADGVKSAFPYVLSLVSAAPNMERWKITAFRPRRNSVCDLQWGDSRVKASDVRYLLFQDNERLGVMVPFKDFEQEKRQDYLRTAYLMLDEAIGEYDMETHIGAIDLDGYDSAYFDRSHPLNELATHFDEAQMRKCANAQ